MKVILLQEVSGLGKPGDVKDVADGYARNYLLPRQMVTPATVTELATLRQKVAAAQRKVERQRQEHEALAARIGGITLTFAVRVGRGDRLYGSVTSQDVANALVEQEGLAVDRRTIQLRDPLRQLGTFEVGIRIAPGTEPKVKIHIIPSEGSVTSEQAAEPAVAPAE
ncbi:MAG: 50S ribosomal protein L9 [Ktedonobacterales bacterium]|nr:50S ribosomal protein L9 [Ktedonobacterales bacterium]